jgi:(p)ppGpp synthase/HD superfamily hydrolase
MFKVTKVKEAMYYAIQLHVAHSYGEYPYLYHLEQVIYTLKRFGFTEDKYIIAAYLHDTIEDCGITYNDVNKKFGKEIADMVWAVSGFGINRKERTACVMPKIKVNHDALILKLADRLSNLSSSLDNNKGMANTYVKEYDHFRSELYVPNTNAEPMWKELESTVMGSKISEYGQ